MRMIDADKLLDDITTIENSSGMGDIFASIFKRYVNQQPTLTPPNEPLTLERLREMDGEPVWFDTIKRWGIVKVNREGIFVVTKSGEYEFGRCKVYRRPPEGEEDTYEMP